MSRKERIEILIKYYKEYLAEDPLEGTDFDRAITANLMNIVYAWTYLDNEIDPDFWKGLSFDADDI